MAEFKKRVNKLEKDAAAAGDGGEHTMTVIYIDDWMVPPREPQTRVMPGLAEDVVIHVQYERDWLNEQV